MAEATIASVSRPHFLGDLKVVFATYTSLADTNTHTFPTGTNIIGAIPVQVVGSPAVQCTVSSNVITWKVSATTPNTTAMVLIGPS